MKEELISFKTAKLAKEKNFIGYNSNIHYRINEECLVNGLIEDYADHNLTKNYLSSPSQSLLQKWLREVHAIIITVEPFSMSLKPSYQYRIDYLTNIWRTKSISIEMSYSNYEEALELGLQEALKLIRTKNNDN